MRYFLVNIDDGNRLSNAIVQASTIEEALRITRNETAKQERRYDENLRV